MKLIQAAGVTLAGMVLLGGVAFRGTSSQVNPPGATPGTTAATSSTAPGAAPATNPGAPVACQPQFNFTDDNGKQIDRQLRPDQTTTLTVEIAFKKNDKSQDNTCKSQTATGTTDNKPGNGTNTSPASNKTNKNTAAKKKTGKKNESHKKGGTNNTGQGTNGTQDDGKGKNVGDDKNASTGPPSLPKFSLEMTPTDYGPQQPIENFNPEKPKGFAPCVASVTPLVADRIWELDKPQKILLSITSCIPNGGKGKLIIVGSSGVKPSLDVTLNARRSPWLRHALIVSLVVAVLISLICAAIVVLQGHKMNDRIGQASWDFSSSWASNITAFGTGITFLLNFTGFPDRSFFGTKLEYSFLTAFATALVALAPGIHRMMSVTGVNQSQNDGSTSATEGLVGGFLAASVFTMWGALLQVGLELLILGELVKSITIYCSIGLVVGIAVGVTAIGLVVYSITTILFTIGGNAARSGTPSAQPLAAFSAAAPSKAQAITTPISVL